MNKTFSVSIPIPCGEKWSSFTPTATGGFCGSCQKNVIDFTQATDDEIMAFIRKRPVDACGRFRSNQFKTYSDLAPIKIKPGLMFFKAGVVGLMLLLISKPSAAQTAAFKSKTEIFRLSQPASAPITTSESVITGVVTFAEDGSPLPGISVVQRNTANGTQTDGDGRFELTLDPTKENVLVFSFIGLQTQEFKIKPGIKQANILMEEDTTRLGEVIIITGMVKIDEPYTEKPGFFKRTWIKIKSIF